MSGTALESRLENSGLNRALQKAITLLIENRPKNPLQFLSAHFNILVNGSPEGLPQAYRLIKLSAPEQPSFCQNVSSSYAAMTAENDLGLVLGGRYKQLLHMICSEWPAGAFNELLQVLEISDEEEVEYSTYFEGLRACLVCASRLADKSPVLQEVALADLFAKLRASADAEGSSMWGDPSLSLKPAVGGEILYAQVIEPSTGSASH